MSNQLPPELLSPGDRASKIAELQHAIALEWVRYAVTEGLLIGIPSLAFLVVWAFTDAISTTRLIVFAILVGAAIAALLAYWLLRRIGPLQTQLRDIELIQARDR